MSNLFFFFNDTATTEIYTLSLHDALPICRSGWQGGQCSVAPGGRSREPGTHGGGAPCPRGPDRKSTPLNSRHQISSYPLFFFEKKSDLRVVNSSHRSASPHPLELPAAPTS